MIRIKRAYDQPAESDGYRILVDRLWPRGLSKVRAHLDEWLKGIAPSPDLRTWWNHDPARMQEFAQRYENELQHNSEAVDHLREVVRTHDVVSLVYATHDPNVNHAVVLQRFLTNALDQGPTAPRREIHVRRHGA